MVELEALETNLERFKKHGAQVVALCPQLSQHNESATRELGLSFPVVTDENNQVATAFGIKTEMPPAVIEAERFLGLDLLAHNGTDNWDLPIPARYVIDRAGVIQFASIHVDHRIRTDPSDLVEQMGLLNS